MILSIQHLYMKYLCYISFLCINNKILFTLLGHIWKRRAASVAVAAATERHVAYREIALLNCQGKGTRQLRIWRLCSATLESRIPVQSELLTWMGCCSVDVILLYHLSISTFSFFSPLSSPQCNSSRLLYRAAMPLVPLRVYLYLCAHGPNLCTYI